MLTRSYVDATIYRLHDRSLDLPLCHDLVANSNAAGPVVTIGTVDVSGRSHQATVGQSLVLSCNTAVAQWKNGFVTITSTNTMSRVYVMSGSSATILIFSPFQTTDARTYTCEYNSTYKTSVETVLASWLHGVPISAIGLTTATLTLYLRPSVDRRCSPGQEASVCCCVFTTTNTGFIIHSPHPQ